MTKILRVHITDRKFKQSGQYYKYTTLLLDTIVDTERRSCYKGCKLFETKNCEKQNINEAWTLRYFLQLSMRSMVNRHHYTIFILVMPQTIERALNAPCFLSEGVPLSIHAPSYEVSGQLPWATDRLSVARALYLYFSGGCSYFQHSDLSLGRFLFAER